MNIYVRVFGFAMLCCAMTFANGGLAMFAISNMSAETWGFLEYTFFIPFHLNPVVVFMFPSIFFVLRIGLELRRQGYFRGDA